MSIGNREIVFLVIFGLLSLQMFLGYIQIRHYQKAVRRCIGKGILGIGQRRGVIAPGEIIILVYNQHEDKVIETQSMKGYSIFAHFVEVRVFSGLSLDEIRKIGIEKDSVEMKFYRKKHPYDPKVLSKKKGALIQAVEAIDLRLRREAEEKENL